MKSRFSFSVVATGIGVAGALLAGGCSTVPPVTEGMAVTPAGTVMTFHRKSSGSLGVFDGPVKWTFTHGQWEGRPVVIQTAERFGGAAFDPVTHMNIANLDASGKTAMRFEPPVGFEWPMQVGKTWTSRHTVTVTASGRTVPLELSWKVEEWGDVQVPAGTFKAYKVVSTSNLGEVETRWVAPAAGVPMVKRLVTRPATHPQGAGELQAVLLSTVPPAK